MQRYVIIVAGGAGKRFGGNTPKQFMLLRGKPVLLHTLNKFHSYSRDINIILVLPEEHIELWQTICQKFVVEIPHVTVAGGRERFFSVRNGLQQIPDDALVAIHDGVRPFVSFDTLDRCFATAEENTNAIPVIPLTESVRLCSDNGNSSFDRSKLRIVQTPQVFRSTILKEAYRQPYSELFTDDASVVEAMGHTINTVEGNRENIKITTPLDLAIGEIILRDGN